jgi:hypothetical protein
MTANGQMQAAVEVPYAENRLSSMTRRTDGPRTGVKASEKRHDVLALVWN